MTVRDAARCPRCGRRVLVNGFRTGPPECVLWPETMGRGVDVVSHRRCYWRTVREHGRRSQHGLHRG